MHKSPHIIRVSYTGAQYDYKMICIYSLVYIQLYLHIYINIYVFIYTQTYRGCGYKQDYGNKKIGSKLDCYCG